MYSSWPQQGTRIDTIPDNTDTFASDIGRSIVAQTAPVDRGYSVMIASVAIAVRSQEYRTEPLLAHLDVASKVEKAIFAPKGLNNVAQGNALGWGNALPSLSLPRRGPDDSAQGNALGIRDHSSNFSRPERAPQRLSTGCGALCGRGGWGVPPTQGVALGCVVWPLQGKDNGGRSTTQGVALGCVVWPLQGKDNGGACPPTQGVALGCVCLAP